MTDRERWNAKYAVSDANEELCPNHWLVRHVPVRQGRALDLACGLGHDAVWLATRGWNVTAIDVSDVALARAAELASHQDVTIDWRREDLTAISLPPAAFDLVVVFQFLQRRHLPVQIVQTLAPGGVLVYETFTNDQLHVSGNHLKNPDYLLRPNELLDLFRPLRVRHYCDVRLEGKAVARLVADKI
jgi:2-polyprenyl-3-methyl-5-hydroxy-6-metoxy-1,4-benzoquinol methylase